MNTSDRFSAKAEQWDADTVRSELASLFASKLRRTIAVHASSTLLEFGCGTGLVSMHLYKAVDSIIMIDTSEGMLDILRQKILRQNISNLRVHKGTLNTLDPPAKDVDIIYTNMVLHHIPDIPGLLYTFRTILKPGGYLCIGDLEKEDGSFHQDDLDVHHGFTCHGLSGILTEQNYTVVEYSRMYTIKKPGMDKNLREYPVFFLCAQTA